VRFLWVRRGPSLWDLALPECPGWEDDTSVTPIDNWLEDNSTLAWGKRGFQA